MACETALQGGGGGKLAVDAVDAVDGKPAEKASLRREVSTAPSPAVREPAVQLSGTWDGSLQGEATPGWSQPGVH